MQSTSLSKKNNAYFTRYSFNNVGVRVFIVGLNNSCFGSLLSVKTTRKINVFIFICRILSKQASYSHALNVSTELKKEKKIKRMVFFLKMYVFFFGFYWI